MLLLGENPSAWFQSAPFFDPATERRCPSPSSPPGSGSDGPNLDLDRILEERRVRRKISNRESARRSRAKKQRRLEELTGEVGRLADENRVLELRLTGVSHGCCLLLLDNERLRLELGSLRLRLGDLAAVLGLRQTGKPAPSFPMGCDWPTASELEGCNGYQPPPMVGL